MTRERSVDERIGAWLLESAPDQLPDRVLTATFERTRAGRQRRTLPSRGSVLARRTTTTALAVGAVAIALIVVGVNLPQRTNPSIGGDASQTPITSATLPTTSPTVEPTVRPTPAPLLWTQASLEEDWPAPVRAEPAGGAIVVPIVPPREVNGQVESAGQHPDGSGDTGSDVFPWVDIHEVGFCQGQTACIFITLVSNHPPVVDPSEQWIAYGVVVDDDGDGVPDRRFGLDNSQVAAPGEDPQRRQWITDLHTGRTVLEDDFGKTFFDTFYPSGASGMDGARLSFGADATGGGKIGGLPERYYAWASVIENGRVVATDYAPDVGWLDPSATTKP